MKYQLIILLLLAINSMVAQSKLDDLSLFDKISTISDDQIFKTEGYYNWGSSIIKGQDGKYHLFYSRWKKEYTFYGWLTHSEIAHAVSDSPAGTWKYKKTALSGLATLSNSFLIKM